VRAQPHPIPRHPVPLARTPASPVDPEDEAEVPFVDRPCYEFNSRLRLTMNDRRCEHCAHYLTARCPHIEEFLDNVEELSPE
jgi:hypothetical protein